MISFPVDCFCITDLCIQKCGIQKQNFTLEFPTSCPHCAKSLIPVFLSAYFTEDKPDSARKDIQAFFFCPDCKQCFQVKYRFSKHNEPYLISEILPHPTQKISFSDHIQNLSKNFVTIYNQAFIAEQSGLDEICGLGYRKALEFLVKDYAIYIKPKDAQNIENMSLSQCIRSYIDDPKIKALATASAWLGNDEAHYVKKHENYNIHHLKAFISSTVSFIDSCLSYEDAMNLLSNC